MAGVMDDVRDALERAAALAGAGRTAEALARLERLLALVPAQPDALNRLGVWAAETGDLRRAVTVLERLLALLPGNPLVRVNLAGVYGRRGVAAQAAGDRDGARRDVRRALALRPEDPHGWCNLGAALDGADAGVAFRRALALAPAAAEGWTGLARLAGAGGRSRMIWTRVARLVPDDAEARLELALCAVMAGDPAAESMGRIAAALAPGRAAALLVPSMLRGAGGWPARAAAARRALRLEPDLAGAWINLANARHGQDRAAEAEAPARRAVALAPGDPDGWSHLALALLRSGRPDAAAAGWRRALTIDPEHAASRWHRACLLLLHGRLAEGWREYERRWAAFPGWARVVPGRRWDGEDPRGLTLLLTREQGLGDLIQFIRFAADLGARGARVLVEGPVLLRRLLENAPGVAGWVDEGKPPPAFDRHAPLMSVPGLLGIDGVERIPAPVPYLRAEPERVERWRRRLGLGPDGRPGLRVGLVWRGGNGDRRSLPLAALEPLGRVPGLRLVSLQKEEADPHPFDRAPAGLTLERPGPGFDGGPDAFLDSAAVMASLDLVLTVDTATAHLAGALGVPAWVMLHSPPEWRWLLGRDDTPWYPTLRLFRQTTPGDWAPVVARVADALAALAARSPARADGSDLGPERMRDALERAGALAQAGRTAEALALAERLLALAPAKPDALNRLGVWAAETGDLRRAVTLLERLHALLPGNPLVRVNLAGVYGRRGVAAQAAGDRDGARHDARRALALRPDGAQDWCNLGAALDGADAATAFRRALALVPDAAEGWKGLAPLAGAADRSRTAWTRLARLAPRDPRARLELAAAAVAAGDAAEAERIGRIAVALAPGWAAVPLLLCMVHGNRGRPALAATAAQRALRLEPDLAGAWINLANARHGQGRTGAMEGPVRRAVALTPGEPGAWSHRAQALFQSGRLDAAAAAWRRALAIDPEHAVSRWHLSFLLLLHGRLAEGWREYEWRWRAFPQRDRSRPGRRWEGEDPRGLTLLLTREQGLGDVVQFIRFAADLRARGARVLAEGPASLRRLLETVPGVDGWVDEGEAPPPVDRHIPLMSVPGLLGIDRLERIPAPVPYLRAEPERVAAWSARLGLHPGGGPGLRVGLVWRGSAVGRRSVPAAALAPLGRVPGVRWIALHKAEEMAGDPPPSNPGPGLAVESPGPGFDEAPDAFLDTAALAVLLDLVVSVDTATAHVAGALGVPVWLMLGQPPDWRWFLERPDDSPWYPGHRLFRHSTPGDWAPVVARVADALAELAARRQAARSSSDVAAAGAEAGAG